MEDLAMAQAMEPTSDVSVSRLLLLSLVLVLLVICDLLSLFFFVVQVPPSWRSKFCPNLYPVSPLPR